MMMCALGRSSVKRAFCRRSFWTSSSIGCAWTATLGQSFEDSLGPLSPPVSQQRRVQTFAAEKGAKGPRVVAATSASCKMRCLYPLCRSAASVWQLLRDPAAKPAPDRRPVWLPPHSAAAKPPRETTTPRELPFISVCFFLALLLIN